MSQLGLFNTDIRGATVDELGIIIPDSENVPESRISDILTRAAKLMRCAHFILGDAVNYALANYEGDIFERYSEITGLEVGTLKSAASVSRKIPRDARRTALTFEHHKICASLLAENRNRWLRIAEEESMNRSRLRKSILLGRIASDDDMIEDPGGGDDNLAPHVNRIVSFGRKLEHEGSFDNARAEDLYVLHRDLLPCIELHIKIMRKLRETGDLTINQELKEDLENLKRNAQ